MGQKAKESDMYHHARRKAFTSMFSASSRASEHAADSLKRNVGSFCFASPSSSASSLRTNSGKSLSHGYRRHQQHQREAASNARRQHQRAFTHSSSSQQQQRFGGGGGGGGGRRGAAAAAAK